MWLFAGRGPGTTPDTHVLGFTRSNPDMPRCDVQYHFTPAGYDLTEDGPILFDRPAVTALNNVHRPWSRGTVGWRPAIRRPSPPSSRTCSPMSGTSGR